MKDLDFNTIKSLISNKEGNQLEFKKTTGQIDRGMETICAFLNYSGGLVLFGVLDDGTIAGQDVTDSTKRSIAEHIREIEPAADVTVSYIPIPATNKQLIALHVGESKAKRPFSYKGRPYMRVESTTVTMPQSIYDDMLSQRDIARNRWEIQLNPGITINDLDENEILKTVRLGIESGRLPENTSNNDVVDILKRFELIRNGYLKNAAAVLFANKSLEDYPQCVLRLARFNGTTKSEFIDNKIVQGNLFVLLDAAMSFLFKHLSLSGVIEGIERKEQLAVPYIALREAVVNALCHRQYRTVGASVGIAIYDDRVEIENPGNFPYDWNLDDVKSEQRSNPRNPLIANVLYKRKLLENWGRGIGLMVSACLKQGLPEPQFKLINNFVVVTFRYANYTNNGVGQQGTGKESAGSWQGVSKELGIESEILKRIYDFCIEPKSLIEIAELLNLHDRYKMKKKYIDPLLGKYIKMTIPDKPNSRNQKYVSI